MLTQDLARTARLFHALSDETRLRILELLRGGEHCVCDLSAALEAQQSRLSFHLRTLKEAGLVSDRRQGRWIYYGLKPSALAEMHAALQSLRDEILGTESVPGCCG
jgi:ArsR family transcriptional regulator